MINYVLITFLALFFALNMGGGTFAASFGAAYGGKVLNEKVVQLLFIIFVFLGAITLGRPVATTLGSKMISPQYINVGTVMIILFSAAISLFIANLLHVPQSTSLVTVGAITGVGTYFSAVNIETILYLVPFWILLPVAGYLLTFLIGKAVYPVRKSNFWFHEKLTNHGGRLKAFVIVASCYNAFSVGTNNVANTVGPLAETGIISTGLGFLLVAPIFGLGSLVFPATLRSAGTKIVPLGLLTAAIIYFVAGTLMIIASYLGVPQSFVMIKMAAIFAIGALKNGHGLTFSDPVARRIYFSWGITPIIAFIISFCLTGIRYAMLNDGVL